jgi:hypothetical protein
MIALMAMGAAICGCRICGCITTAQSAVAPAADRQPERQQQGQHDPPPTAFVAH